MIENAQVGLWPNFPSPNTSNNTFDTALNDGCHYLDHPSDDRWDHIDNSPERALA